MSHSFGAFSGKKRRKWHCVVDDSGISSGVVITTKCRLKEGEGKVLARRTEIAYEAIIRENNWFDELAGLSGLITWTLNPFKRQKEIIYAAHNGSVNWNSKSV